MTDCGAGYTFGDTPIVCTLEVGHHGSHYSEELYFPVHWTANTRPWTTEQAAS